MNKIMRLGGKELRCADKIPLGTLFDLAEAMDGGNEMAQVAAMSRTIRFIVVKEDRLLLKEILSADGANAVSFEELNTALGSVIQEYGQRPTVPASASLPGRGASRPTSKVVSLWPGTDKEAKKSTRAGKSRAS